MRVIVTTKDGRSRQMDFARSRARAISAGAVLTVLVGLIGLGYAGGRMAGSTQPAEAVVAMKTDLAVQEIELAEVREEAQRRLTALAAKVGELNAHVIRLDALGERLVAVAELDDGEFEFNSLPAQGGPDTEAMEAAVSSADIDELIDSLSRRLSDRSRQLDVLEDVLTSRQVRDAARPEGRPIRTGWLSSYYGKRTDPFTGRQAFHHGVDYAGPAGSDVLAVAAGVVTFSGERFGYGEMIEISHGSGLVTRYGHNDQNLVQVGDTVQKGEAIALMGSSGRSTGPHVHLEVLKNGKKVNPLKYVR
jgi:murein DD-endopeptidase MepM/ murein hydrolase activator NlpD